MQTKLTLRMEEAVIRTAKAEAKRRGKSVSRMVADFIESVSLKLDGDKSLPPITASLVGILKGQKADEKDYRAHLLEKYP
jgi:hypothetical protein